MQKKLIVEAICAQLVREQQTAAMAAESARQGATHEDARAENQYDTRGLESSYLAGAQAERALALAKSVNLLQNLNIRNYSSDDKIGLTALVEVDDGNSQQLYFLANDSGGMKISIEDRVVMVLTPESPMGKAIMGKSQGDVIEVLVKKKTREFEIRQVG